MLLSPENSYADYADETQITPIFIEDGKQRNCPAPLPLKAKVTVEHLF
jgi:hypothetical protein